MGFSQQAKELREAMGFSQKELSKHLGISASGIGHLETGRNEPTASTLIAYSNYFKIPIDELLDDELTPEERAAGASLTKKISITPIEDEMLYTFRQIGKKRGEEAQRALITVAEKML